MTAPSTGLNPVTGATTVRRGRVPDGASYRVGGVFAQAVVEAMPSKVQLVGNVRVNSASYRARAADSPIVNGQPLWPDDELQATGVAFRAGVSASATDTWSVTANLSRGFRAPHITDLGTLGLTGSGFEVSAPEVAGLGGTVGSTADASAVSLGTPIDQVGPEASLTYEGGLHYRRSTMRSSLAVFVNEIHDNIAKQSLILPAGAVGKTLGGHADHQPERERRRLRRRRDQPGARARQLRQRAHHRRGAHLRLAAEPAVARRHDVHVPAREGHAHRAAAEHRGRHARAGGVLSRATTPRGTAAGGPARTCTRPRRRVVCRRSISTIGAPARAARAPASATSS